MSEDQFQRPFHIVFKGGIHEPSFVNNTFSSVTRVISAFLMLLLEKRYKGNFLGQRGASRLQTLNEKADKNGQLPGMV